MTKSLAIVSLLAAIVNALPTEKKVLSINGTQSVIEFHDRNSQPLINGTSHTKANGGTIAVNVHDGDFSGYDIPTGFLGASIEASELSSAFINPDIGNAWRLLGNFGRGGSIRIGGVSADQESWYGTVTDPTSGSDVFPADFVKLNAFARKIGWIVDLTVNLQTGTLAAASDQVYFAKKSLTDILRYVAIGNEPNLPFGPGGLPAEKYQRLIPEFREAIENRTRGIVYGGPDIIAPTPVSSIAHKDNPDPITWRQLYINLNGNAKGYLTQHYYPTAFDTNPTIAHLLSDDTQRGQIKLLDQFAQQAHDANLTPLISECGIEAGRGSDRETNSLTSALFMANFALDAATRGIRGINVHSNIEECYSYSMICMLEYATSTMLARPLYYGPLFVSQLVGGRFLNLDYSGTGNVRAHAVQMPNGHIKVALINLEDKSHTFSVNVGRTPSRATATWLVGGRLESGLVVFANAVVLLDGSFNPLPAERVDIGRDGTVSLNFDSAAAVILELIF